MIIAYPGDIVSYKYLSFGGFVDACGMVLRKVGMWKVEIFWIYGKDEDMTVEEIFYLERVR